MILVDTSIWIDHLHRRDDRLVEILETGEASVHPMVIGEIALGTLKSRTDELHLLARLPTARRASDRELLAFVEARRLFGRGLDLVDAHVLASTLLTPATRLWTRDRRLRTAAAELGVDWAP